MSQNPFVRDAGVAKPGIIGARWWNKSLREGSSTTGRRSALSALLIAGGVVALFGATVYACVKVAGSDDDEATREEKRRSVDLQRDYGWNFGAVSETVAFDVAYTQTYARQALKTLVEDLAPGTAPNRPYYVQTLFESPEAVPRLTLPDGDTTRVAPLADALKPIFTPSMETSEKRGRAYGALIAKVTVLTLTIVDLPGPEAVAFAAGAAQYLDPIFLFDNWPHPRGVVPAHQTLAAAVYYQPAFASAKEKRGQLVPPMVVLDRARLAAYTDEATQFDNRYLAKLPPYGGLKRVMYVVPSASDLPEKDDLNGQFATWMAQKVDVRAIAADSFLPNSAGGTEYIFGRSPKEHDAFFGDYGWEGQSASASSVSTNEPARSYRPVARSVTDNDSNIIGYAPVVIAAGTGLLLGAKLNRSGSWNRSSGNYGGG